jgi:hypothetical protein
MSESTPFLAKRRDIQRRGVNGCGEPAGGGFEPSEHLINTCKFGSAVKQSLVFEASCDFPHKISTNSRSIGQGSQDPYRRSAESQNADQLDPVACRAANQKIFRKFLLARIHAFHLSDLFD